MELVLVFLKSSIIIILKKRIYQNDWMNIKKNIKNIQIHYTFNNFFNTIQLVL